MNRFSILPGAIGRLLCSLLLLISFVFAATGVSAQPSQKPLLNRDGGGVKPNIMLTVDDSGSMWFQHMPEGRVFLGASTTAVSSPIRTFTLSDGVTAGSHATWHNPSETYKGPSWAGTIAGIPNSTNWRQAFQRSPDTNFIYYNPEIQYKPWLLPDGTRMPNSTPTAAWNNPMSKADGTVNLTITTTSVASAWCFITNTDSLCWFWDGTGGGTTAANNKNLPFDPGLYYRLNKTGTSTFADPTNFSNYVKYTVNPSVTSTTFTRVSARLDCTTSTSYCTRDEQRRNYANWYTYYRSRQLFAKASLSEAFYDVTDAVRVGYGRINKSTATTVDGSSTTTVEAGVRTYDTTRRTTVMDWIRNLPISGGTPLRRAMGDVGEYYKRSDNSGPWSDDPGAGSTNPHATCRRAYHILVTDGYWNESLSSGPGNVDNTDGSTIVGPGRTYKYVAAKPFADSGSDRLADMAMKYWAGDLRPDLTNKVVPSSDNPAFWQSMTNFIVGLGVRGQLDPDKDLPYLTSGTKTWTADRIDDLWHAAVNSRGAYFSARDPVELASAVKTSLGLAVQRELREAGVATASTVLENDNRKYVPLYKTGVWAGDVQAFALDSNGQAGALQWNAEAKMPTWSARNIVTWNPATTSTLTFTWASLTPALRTALVGTTGTTAFTATLVDFLRGDRSNEGTDDDTKPFRTRAGVLGDFINSNPVLIKGGLNMNYGSLPGSGGSYASYIASKSTRPGVLYIGGNDGMLHAFKDTKSNPTTDGAEVFAYIPSIVLPTLPRLTSKSYGTTDLLHQYYVDGPLREADVFTKAPGASSDSWRNYLFGSLGAGGKGVFGLDVTTSDAPVVRFELGAASDDDFGYVMAPLDSGVLPNGEWVVVWGNGAYSVNGDSVLYVLRLSDMSVRKLQVDATTGSGLTGVSLLRNSAGEITSIYAGDLKGNMWRLNYHSSATSYFVKADSVPLFQAKGPTGLSQPITQAPALFNHPDGGNLLVFGTGQLFTESDADGTTTQSLYGVWDKPSDSVPRPMTRTSLIDRTVTTSIGAGSVTFFQITGTDVNWTSHRGWRIDLNFINGMRLIYPPQAVNGELVLISPIAPARNVQACDSGSGTGASLIIPALTGENPTYKLFDTDGDGQYINDTGDVIAAGVQTGADGIDAIVYSSAANSSGATSDGPCPAGYYRVSIQNTTGQNLVCVKGNSPSGTLGDRIWRRILNPPIR